MCRCTEPQWKFIFTKWQLYIMKLNLWNLLLLISFIVSIEMINPTQKDTSENEKPQQVETRVNLSPELQAYIRKHGHSNLMLSTIQYQTATGRISNQDLAKSQISMIMSLKQRLTDLKTFGQSLKNFHQEFVRLIQKAVFSITVTLLHMKRELWNRRFHIASKQLIEQIDKVIAFGESIIAFLYSSYPYYREQVNKASVNRAKIMLQIDKNRLDVNPSNSLMKPPQSYLMPINSYILKKMLSRSCIRKAFKQAKIDASVFESQGCKLNYPKRTGNGDVDNANFEFVILQETETVQTRLIDLIQARQILDQLYQQNQCQNMRIVWLLGQIYDKIESMQQKIIEYSSTNTVIENKLDKLLKRVSQVKTKVMGSHDVEVKQLYSKLTEQMKAELNSRQRRKELVNKTVKQLTKAKLSSKTMINSTQNRKEFVRKIVKQLTRAELSSEIVIISDQDQESHPTKKQRTQQSTEQPQPSTSKCLAGKRSKGRLTKQSQLSHSQSSQSQSSTSKCLKGKKSLGKFKHLTGAQQIPVIITNEEQQNNQPSFQHLQNLLVRFEEFNAQFNFQEDAHAARTAHIMIPTVSVGADVGTLHVVSIAHPANTGDPHTPNAQHHSPSRVATISASVKAIKSVSQPRKSPQSPHSSSKEVSHSSDTDFETQLNELISKQKGSDPDFDKQLKDLLARQTTHGSDTDFKKQLKEFISKQEQRGSDPNFDRQLNDFLTRQASHGSGMNFDEQLTEFLSEYRVPSSQTLLQDLFGQAPLDSQPQPNQDGMKGKNPH